MSDRKTHPLVGPLHAQFGTSLDTRFAAEARASLLPSHPLPLPLLTLVHPPRADFGVSQVLETDDDLITKSAGTPAFMAPECCRAGAFHGKLADLWACGCTLFFFVHGRVPFINANVFELYEDIQNNEIVYDGALPADLLGLLKSMLEKDPESRLKVSA